MFCDNLKKIRNEKNLTQKELADKLQVAPSTIGMYEIGERLPDISTLNKFAEIFNVSTDYLLGRPNNKVIDAISDNPELLEFTSELYKRDSTKKLLEELKDKDKETIYKVIDIIKSIEDNEDNN